MTITEESVVMYSTPEEIRQERVNDFLYNLASMESFLEAHPDLIPDSGGLNLTVTAWTAEELATRMRQLGTCEKIDSDWYSGGRVRFGDHNVAVQTYKENTCEKILTGEIKVKVIEATPTLPIPEGARNVRTVTKTVYDVDEPVTTWSCPDSLLNPSSEEGEPKDD